MHNDIYKAQSFTRLIRCQKKFLTPTTNAFFKDPDSFIANAKRIIKHDRTTTVCEVDLDNQAFIIKRYNLKNSWGRLKRLFTNSRASKCWFNAMQLNQHQILHAEPVAMLEKRFGPCRGKAYLVLKKAANDTLSAVLETNQIKTIDLKKLAREFAKLFIALYRARISHGDLNIHNIIISADLGISLLDLDSMKTHFFNAPLRQEIRKDKQRLLKSWIEKSAHEEPFFQTLNKYLVKILD